MKRNTSWVALSFVIAASAGWVMADSGAEKDKAAAESALGVVDIKALNKAAARASGLNQVRGFPRLPDIFKTRCQLTYNGRFSPGTAIGANCAEAKEKAVNECTFWASLDTCRAGTMVCTHVATGAPICLGD